MNGIKDHSGWFMAAWAFMLGHWPAAAEWLVYLSIVLILAQTTWVILKIINRIRRGK